MSLVRYTALLALIFILASGVTAAGKPTPADLAKDLVDVMSTQPPGFVAAQVDKTPTVTVDGHKGYRIVLRREYEVDLHAMPQQAQAEPVQTIVKPAIKWSHIDLVLFPATDKVTSALKDRIEWQDLAQEYHVRPVYMGKGRGYHWFARTTMFWQDEMRRRMELTGGDDRAALAVEALGIQDNWTPDAASSIFRDLGDAAIPALQEAIRNHEKDDARLYISQLGHIETDKSTALLRILYKSPNPGISQHAAHVLVDYHARQAARPEYLDMLHRRHETASVAGICARFGWKEAVPDLEAVMANPPSWNDFHTAFFAHRTLTGRPVPKSVTDAGGGIIWQDKYGDKARSTLLKAQDKEAAAVIVISRYGNYGKADKDEAEMQNRQVLEMLSKLPDGIVRPMVEHIARSVTDEYDKIRFTELLGQL